MTLLGKQVIPDVWWPNSVSWKPVRNVEVSQSMPPKFQAALPDGMLIYSFLTFLAAPITNIPILGNTSTSLPPGDFFIEVELTNYAFLLFLYFLLSQNSSHSLLLLPWPVHWCRVCCLISKYLGIFQVFFCCWYLINFIVDRGHALHESV